MTDVRRYLEQFRTGLKAMPEAERNEIVQEIASHIAEAAGSGRPLAEVLERLGPADRLARAYTAEAILSGPGRPVRKWWAAAAVLTASGLGSLFVIPVLGIFGLVFPVAGLLGILGNVLYLLLRHPVRHLGITTTPWFADPGWNQVLGICIGLVIIPLGLWALVGLKRYIRFMIRTVRGTLN